MSVVFLHTADWQLGKPFAGIEDHLKRALIQQERINAVARVGAVAHAHGAKFIVIAGDLFDSPSAPKATVAAACAAIGAIALPVFVVPGNHDHAGPGSVWEQPFFQHERAQLAPNLTVLLEPRPVEIESAVLLPCPMLRRHESADTTQWLRAAELEGFGDKPRIVIAHGSVHGFASGDEAEGGAVNRIDLPRLPDSALDYVALGDWHGMKQVAPKAWYAGTPELDRFVRGESNEPGQVLVVTAARGVAPAVAPVRTAQLGWHRVPFDFAEDADVERFQQEIDAAIGQRAQRDLLALELRGALGIEAMTRLEQKLEAWQARLLRLDVSNEVRVAPSPDEIDALAHRTTDPLISRVASKLLELASGTDAGRAACARVALRELHASCRSL